MFGELSVCTRLFVCEAQRIDGSPALVVVLVDHGSMLDHQCAHFWRHNCLEKRTGPVLVCAHVLVGVRTRDQQLSERLDLVFIHGFVNCLRVANKLLYFSLMRRGGIDVPLNGQLQGMVNFFFVWTVVENHLRIHLDQLLTLQVKASAGSQLKRCQSLLGDHGSSLLEQAVAELHVQVGAECA